MMVGLLGSMVLLVDIGIPDAWGALTFAGRVTGFLFVLLGVVDGMAALAVLDYWGRRKLKHSGAVILLAVLIALASDSLLLILWLQEREHTPYLLMYFPLWCWSLWALRILFREKAWREIPHPKKFAAGVTATALLATVNIAYSAIYQPTAAPVLFSVKITFGKPRIDPERSIIFLPVTLQEKNTGTVPSYILADDYTVYGRSDKYANRDKGLRDTRNAMENEDDDARLYAGVPTRETVSAGTLYQPGAWLEPGELYTEDRVIEFPKSAKYDAVEADLYVTIMRKDRGKIDEEFAIPRYSWHKDEGRFYCPPDKCGEYVIHHGVIRHNNNLINVTRRPRYVNSIWEVNSQNSQSGVYISSDPGGGDDSKGEEGRYGIEEAEAHVTIPFAALLSPPGV
ncbi:hypothetical protein ACFCVY_10635 [Streptomyces sp. NPDC056411]|uniref:hypothetical protein n=1 Tax=Streptomyces sp. NPDC056411 TaxID=3345813 RepID=UPI0035D5B31C